MPRLSETLQFTIRQVTGGTITYPPSTTGPQTYFSDKVKGDGFYRGHLGLHTVTYIPRPIGPTTQPGLSTQFVGNVIMQATLATDPTDADWFDIDSTYNDFTVDYTNKFFNFNGNYVWIRAKVVISSGILQAILYNH